MVDCPLVGLELGYISVDLSSRGGSGVRAPSGRRVLRGILKSGCEYLAIAGVRKFTRGVHRVRRLVRRRLKATTPDRHRTSSILQDGPTLGSNDCNRERGLVYSEGDV